MVLEGRISSTMSKKCKKDMAAEVIIHSNDFWYNRHSLRDDVHTIGDMEIQKANSYTFRGRVTVHEIQLNRPELLERRLEKLHRIQEILDLIAKAPNDAVRKALSSRIEAELDSGAEYLLVARTAYDQFCA